MRRFWLNLLAWSLVFRFLFLTQMQNGQNRTGGKSCESFELIWLLAAVFSRPKGLVAIYKI